MWKCLRVTVRSSVKSVIHDAYARFAVKSWKSQRANSEDSVHGKEKPLSENEKQEELREARDAPEKGGAKLGLNHFLRLLFF